MEILNEIDAVTCLVLDKRYEQWLELKNQCEKLLFKPKGFIVGDGSNDQLTYDRVDEKELPLRYVDSISYPSWYSRPNAYNAWKSHRAIFEQAVSDNRRNLLLLEDDAYIEDDIVTVLEQADPFFRENNWDMIYFGCYSNGHISSTTNPVVYRAFGAGGFHGVLIKHHIMKKLLAFGPIGPYDWIAGQHLHQHYHCYAIHPCVIMQRSGFSFVEGGNLGKPDRYVK